MPAIRDRRRRLPVAPIGQLTTPFDNHTAPIGYAPVLADGWAIADLVASLAPDEVDKEMISEMFRDCRAVLRFVPLAKLTEGPADHNIPNRRREAAYAKLPAATLPPILVDEGTIQDGHHRFRMAKAAGATGLWAYVIEAES